MTGPLDAPRVVMLVANGVTNDSRVRKEAAALAAVGVEVTVLGLAPFGEQQSREMLDGVLVVRVAAPFDLREQRKERRTRRREWRPPLAGYRTERAYVARTHRVAAGLKALKADSGQAMTAKKPGLAGSLGFKTGVLTRSVRRVGWQTARSGISLRKGVGKLVDKPFRFGWRAFDGVIHRMSWPAPWRRVHPEAIDLELAFGDVIDRLEPDVVHAHDMHVIGVGSQAAGRAKLRGKDLKFVYDAHEYVAGLSRYGGRTRRFIKAWANHEAEYIRNADRIITVSPAIARTLKTRYQLTTEPTVIINSPSLSEVSAESVDLRSRLGLADDVPLLVYSGAVTKARGIETAIEALKQLPGVQLAVVCVPSTKMPSVDQLKDLAVKLQVDDRVHYVEPVGYAEVVSFLRTADVGLIPILRYPSHEMALPNKVFEYIFAGLPVVTSNMQSLSEFVGRTGIGEVFEAADAADLAAKVKLVLADPDSYRERLTDPEYLQEVSWDGQAAHLRDLYTEMLGRSLEIAPQAAGESYGRRVLIGPVNTAGEAWQWATAITREVPSIAAESLTTGDEPGAKVHRTGTSKQYSGDLRWQLQLTSWALRNVTHVLFEAGQPMFGQLDGQLFDENVPMLDSAGIQHGVIFNGPELDEVLRERLAGYSGPRFVTSPDLVESVENSEWLPFAVELNELASSESVLERKIPVVLHAASQDAVDEVLTALEAKGLIEYQRDADSVKSADIVVDDLTLGSYGVFACEAMAAGRVTVGHVTDQVRELLPTELPIIEAAPGDLAEVIGWLIEEREEGRKLADAGPPYVREVHDGRKSVEVLLPFLGGR